MNHDELRIRMADYLDGLLEENEVKEVEELIAREAALFADVVRVRTLLYRPYPVASPRPEQAARILARAARRPWGRFARYAAVFVAGVLTTLLVQLSTARSQESETRNVESPVTAAPTVVHNRVLR